MSEQDRPKGSMTVQQAGKRGGEAIKARIGREGYQRLGKMGGETVRDTYGYEYYSEIGRKGGEANRAAHEDDPGYFQRLGRRGGARVRELMEAGRRAEAEEQRR